MDQGSEDRFEEGRQAFEKIWGKSFFNRFDRHMERLHPSFREFALHAWSLFDRPQLPYKTRSLCLVAAFTAMGYMDELKAHIFGALSNGATPEEIKEVIMHISPYAGVPKGQHALITANEAIAEFKPPQDKA